MRIMFDGIIPGEVPPGAQLYAAYLDGRWADFTALAAKFPGAVHVSIAVSASHDEGQVLDVENGDATPAESVGWVRLRRAAGADPTVYCSMDNWPNVRAAHRTAGVPEPHYWIADYSLGSSPVLPAGAVALQYADRGGYDESIVADYWPGVDPVPAPKPPAATQPQQEEPMPYLVSVIPDPSNPANKGAGIFLITPTGSVVHVTDQTSEGSFVSRFGQPLPITQAQYAELLTVQPAKA